MPAVPSSSGELASAFEYDGDATCATDGLCAMSCPVGIDTGQLVKHLRSEKRSRRSNLVASFIASHMTQTTALMRVALSIIHLVHRAVGTTMIAGVAKALRSISRGRLPLWNPWMPRGAPKLGANVTPMNGRAKVVYVPSCINRSMGLPSRTSLSGFLPATIIGLLDRAGYEVIFPQNLSSLCCGMAFASKGFTEQGEMKIREMERALLNATSAGEFPVLMDMSPCLMRMKDGMDSRLKLYEPVEFALQFLVDRLELRKVPGPITVHSTCSARKMGLESSLLALARRCAEQVVVPDGIECCGWAGDRGFTVPELNASALAGLKEQIPHDCQRGYSTSRTCEIGLSLHSGIEYGSILYLLEECSRGGAKRG